MLLSLPLWLTGCASDSSVRSDAARCEHPVVDVTKNGGLADALLLYADALDTCNALNGFPIENDE